MTLFELFVLLRPLILVLGTILLVCGTAALTIYALYRLIKALWKFIVIAGVAVFVIILVTAFTSPVPLF